MNILTLLATEPSVLILVVGILGLIVGSFLNVVIYRLPIMMECSFQQECAEFYQYNNNIDNFKKLIFLKKLGLEPRRIRQLFIATNFNVTSPKHCESFNLWMPRSRCPHCGHLITALENIPIISFIWQRGQCTACHQAISLRYPLVEALSAILAVSIAYRFGFGWPLLGALALTWALLAASLIDFDHQLLPDSITLPLLWLGLFCNLFGLYTDIISAIIGAMAGYLLLWSVYWLFKLVTKKEGMGYGDFKLLAMLGAFLGWQQLPFIIFMSSLVGAVVGIFLVLRRGHDKNVPIPYGPYLAAAGWISLLWGSPFLIFSF
ncbi:A24 family peptidase [Candidatus Parabeggiatoa sp. HSG14]|uniref:prepilin peptidase n=1 Tax=Candidatus Parabeggiatoa sp. HSG14 TaxID=3055593 RepID=UPI0025A82B68|nr:A24 family peptidase [Thiotrichales bacterium HSG14]